MTNQRHTADKNLGPSRFLLTGHESGGKATLLMFEGSNILEGGWVEEGAKGMWRVRLG